MHTQPRSLAHLRHVPPPCSWVEQRVVRERALERLRHAACALSLFLVTVAEAQGLSDDADASLCQRLAMTSTALHQARQALTTRGLVASQRPRSHVCALDAAPRESTASREAPAQAAASGAAADPVDLQAVFARLWEGLS